MVMIHSPSINTELLNSRVLQLSGVTPMQEKKLWMVLSILWFDRAHVTKSEWIDARVM